MCYLSCVLAYPTISKHEDLDEVWFHECEGRVPYTPLQATHYLYTGIKK